MVFSEQPGSTEAQFGVFSIKADTGQMSHSQKSLKRIIKGLYGILRLGLLGFVSGALTIAQIKEAEEPSRRAEVDARYSSSAQQS